MNQPITPSIPSFPTNPTIPAIPHTRPARRAPLLGLALLSVGWLCTSCGTAATGLDERCADLAATGYNQRPNIEALLRIAKQPTAGSPDALRQRAKAFCLQLGSGNLSKP